jgi:hypothetical protein
VAERAHELFAEYASAYARGERPRAHEYLDRAGTHADELAALIDRFVQAAPVPPADERAIVELESLVGGEPPLLRMRVRHGIRIDAVVEALMERLGLDPAKREKVKRYYQRLEGGLLEPTAVSHRVWAVIGDVVGREARLQSGWQPSRSVPTQSVYLRAQDEPLGVGAAAPAAAEPDERDEVDRLFLGPQD